MQLLLPKPGREDSSLQPISLSVSGLIIIVYFPRVLPNRVRIGPIGLHFGENRWMCYHLIPG